jgi:adenosylhomocysteine nucleosidase
MNIVVICPMKVELEAVINNATNPIKKEYKYISGYEFETKLGTVFAFEAGIGKTNMGFDLAYINSIKHIDRVICLGVAGGIKDFIHQLDIVVATKVAYHDVDATAFGDKYVLGQLPGNELYFKADEEFISKLDNYKDDINHSKLYKGLIITGDQFATANNMPMTLINKFDDPYAVDMESAAVGQMCTRLNIPFNIIRSISDCIYKPESQQVNTYNNFEKLSANQASKILFYLLNN